MTGSINPGQEPVGGCQFYASTPLDLSDATSITFQYSVYFTPDFDFVKGGKVSWDFFPVVRYLSPSRPTDFSLFSLALFLSFSYLVVHSCLVYTVVLKAAQGEIQPKIAGQVE